MKRLTAVVLTVLVLAGCSGSDWYCVEDGEILYSRSNKGEWGDAGKGCSCNEMRSFEKKVFGSVDEAALKKDFGC